jgi:hypothetical protein
MLPTGQEVQLEIPELVSLEAQGHRLSSENSGDAEEARER